MALVTQRIIKQITQPRGGYLKSSEFEESENDNLLSMADIMKALSCTRYMVMKYYSEEGLPLVKMNNRYFINRYDLIEWLEKMEAKRKRQQMILLGVSVIVIIFLIIFVLILFSIAR